MGMKIMAITRTKLHHQTVAEISQEFRLRRILSVVFVITAIGGIWGLGAKLTKSQTLQLEAERDRDDQLRRAELIIVSAPVALITCGPDGIIIVANPMCEDLFGYKPEELVGRNVNTLIPFENRAKHDVTMRKAVSLVESGPDNHMIRRTGLIADGLHKNGERVKVSIALRMIKYSGKAEFIASFRHASGENPIIFDDVRSKLESKPLPDLDRQREAQQIRRADK